MTFVSVCRVAFMYAIVFTTGLYSQGNGRLSGLVVDTSGAAIPGASITLTLSGGSKAALEGETSSEGLFKFTGVRAERYDVAIESKGFSRQLLRGIVVDPGRETAIPTIR